jgi:hypothetical protein
MCSLRARDTGAFYGIPATGKTTAPLHDMSGDGW